MNILISNDDGIRAEGIARLAAAAPRPTASRQLSRPSSPAGRTWC